MGSPTGAGLRVVGGRYRLIDRLGQGGMGTVWRAHDELLDRAVAVKQVDLPQLSEIDRAELRKRTMREARTAARLSHPNAVTVHDVVEEDGQPWIVMQLVAAQSLAEALQAKGPLPPRVVAEIGLAVLSALEAAHGAGILHRDVKPGNVLLGHDGRVVLTDFGLATLEGDPALTAAGLLFGSPAYMAPERAQGLLPGPASDLWSLGATLYAAVEGRAPYDRSSPMATLAALISEEPPPPRAAGALTPAIRALLERDPARRPDIAGARRLLQQARAAPDEQSTTIVPTPRPGRAGGRSGRSPVLLGLLALVLTGLVVAGVLIVNPGDSQRPGPSPSTGVKPTASASAAGPVAIPAGFVRHTDPAGYSVAVPVGWKKTDEGFGTMFTDPKSNDRWLLFWHEDGPSLDPLDELKEDAEGSQARSSYRESFLGPVRYRSYPAGEWDYTDIDSDTSVPGHHRVRAFKVGSRIYFIALRTPEDEWDVNVKYFEGAVDTFRQAS